MRLPHSPFRPIIAALAGSLLLGGCGKPTPDVRLSLCKDLGSELSGGSADALTWETEEVQPHGYAGLDIRLTFTSTANGSHALACHYEHEAKDETALTLSNPLSAYATYPTQVISDGRTLGDRETFDAVNAVLKKQGKRLLDKIHDQVDKAGR